MNIFVLSEDPEVAARDHCDKHVLKMCIEYAQLLSTAHRVLDGEPVAAGRKVMRLLQGERLQIADGAVAIDNAKAMRETHANHPCAIWARESRDNYNFLHELWQALLREYTHRYGRAHASGRFLLHRAPRNIAGAARTPFAQAMPSQYRRETAVDAYREFYIGDKSRFAKWSKRPVPEWYAARVGAHGAFCSNERIIR